MGAWTQLGVGIARAFGMGKLANEVDRLQKELRKANLSIRSLRVEVTDLTRKLQIMRQERDNWHAAWRRAKGGDLPSPGESPPLPPNPY
jgi:hypothetical protein